VTKFHKVHSTQIHSIAYDPKTQTLVVVFEKESTPSSAYAYARVPEAVFLNLLQESPGVEDKQTDCSVGRYFNENVKKAGYDYVPVPLELLRLSFADDSCPAGTEVSVTWGEEVYCPQAYQSMRLGPFAMTTKTKEGETPAEAAERALRHLDQIARNHFAGKRNGFRDRLQESRQ
jgi:hypothetical protein